MHFIFSIPLVVIVLSVLSIISFFLSASETSIIALNKIRLRHLVEQGKRGALAVQNLVTKLDKLIAAILIGNNFVNIAISVLITVIFVQLFGYQLGIVLATFSSTFFVLVFCEITPKILATKSPERVALFMAPFMELLIRALGPVIIIFTGISDCILRLMRIQPVKRSPLVTEEELRMIIEIGKEEGVLSDEERKMLHKIFEFGDTKVGEVMVPKTKMVAVDSSISSEALLNIFVEQGHARLPVYSGSIENIIGVVYANDLLYILRDKRLFVLQDLLRMVYCVAPLVRVNELLRKFQADRIQIAVVVDEQKNTLGMVTLEDLLEEIVGEIEEEKGSHMVKKR
ncbi:MAG: hemolysin family protein [Candidatus Omnitrophota bacterium]|jgi:CBS domain containing-hemolysin-like protein